MTAKILCVDDDPNLLAGVQRNLRKKYSLDVASSGQEALEKLASDGPYAVVVADMQMPGMTGVELLKLVEQRAPETVRVMLTGNADQQTAIQAVNEGHVYRFLAKPCPPETLEWALEASLQYHRLVVTEKELLEKTLNGSVLLLLDILSLVEPDSFGRAQKLREYMQTFIRSLKDTQSWELEISAMLCEIGLVTIPADLRLKARSGAAISPTEQGVLSRLPEVGAKLLRRIPRMEGISRIVLYQAKNFDGTGFPNDELKGEDLPLGARILKVLNGLIQLEEKQIPKAQALEMMQKRNGCYDPRILDGVFACFDVYLTRASSSVPATQALRVRDLQVGQTLLSNVLNQDGVMLVPAGTKITSTLLERLHNFAELSGLKEPIYVEG